MRKHTWCDHLKGHAMVGNKVQLLSLHGPTCDAAVWPVEGVCSKEKLCAYVCVRPFYFPPLWFWKLKSTLFYRHNIIRTAVNWTPNYCKHVRVYVSPRLQVYIVWSKGHTEHVKLTVTAPPVSRGSNKHQPMGVATKYIVLMSIKWPIIII